ncbi:hypothetical protein [Methylosinus sp. RM1]|uniref:head-tail joining protein n=1 Tax=Methylosinus sp. RM1 TaxID=2583817 RepID=UPI00140CEB68|nr:hypothetical protein [Methylosinus sp. RM1]
MGLFDPPNFRQLMNMVVEPGHNEHFGETFEIQRCVFRPNRQSQPDGSPPIVANGIWDEEPHLSMVGGEESGVMSTDPQVSFAHRDLPVPLNRGDQIRRMSDDVLYEITAVKPDGMSRIFVDVVRLGLNDQ